MSINMYAALRMEDSSRMHAGQAIEDVLRVLKYLKRAAPAGCHAGSRNAPQISKDFQNVAVRGCVIGRGNPALINTVQAAHMNTHVGVHARVRAKSERQSASALLANSKGRANY